MSVRTADKPKIIETFRVHDRDTGSPEVQIALLTERIKKITEHLKTHSKDSSSRRGLIVLVGHRSSFLKYLSRSHSERYQWVLKELGLRK